MASHFLDHLVPLIPQRFCPDSSWISISGYLCLFYLGFLYIHNHLRSHATPSALFAFEHESQSLSSGKPFSALSWFVVERLIIFANILINSIDFGSIDVCTGATVGRFWVAC